MFMRCCCEEIHSRESFKSGVNYWSMCPSLWSLGSAKCLLFTWLACKTFWVTNQGVNGCRATSGGDSRLHLLNRRYLRPTGFNVGFMSFLTGYNYTFA